MDTSSLSIDPHNHDEAKVLYYIKVVVEGVFFFSHGNIFTALASRWNKTFKEQMQLKDAKFDIK